MAGLTGNRKSELANFTLECVQKINIVLLLSFEAIVVVPVVIAISIGPIRSQYLEVMSRYDA